MQSVLYVLSLRRGGEVKRLLNSLDTYHVGRGACVLGIRDVWHWPS